MKKPKERTDEQSLRDIETLLNLYPGMSSANASSCGDDRVSIKFQCNSFESLRELAHHATYTNVGIEVGSIMTEHDDLYFHVTIRDKSSGKPTQPQIFGIFLASDLHGRGLLSAIEANKLLRGWNAARVCEDESTH